MITRRRFLTIAAASLAGPAFAEPVRWQGRAMGADVSLTLDVDPALANPVIAQVRDTLARCEKLFSIYDPASSLSQLNRYGRLADPEPEFIELLSICDRAHGLTGGRFDPTVQPLWRAISTSGDIDAARALIGWHRVRMSAKQVELGPRQALTFNGVAQGYATDLVAGLLRKAGMTRVLVNIGEFHAGGRPWTLGISDPVHGLVATRTLTDRAIATSSPGAMTLGGGAGHILDPIGTGRAVWSTVSVEAADAATADALSTALCHAPADEIAATLAATPGRPAATCVARNGHVTRITG